jgi:hypothetical protein
VTSSSPFSTESPEDLVVDLAASQQAQRARHRTPGRARIGGPQLPERAALGTALLLSLIAVALSVQGARGAAITVAAVGLVLAVSGLVLGWRSSNLRRGSGSRAR